MIGAMFVIEFEGGLFHWELRLTVDGRPVGEVLAQGPHGYPTRRAAIEAIEGIRKLFADAPIFPETPVGPVPRGNVRIDVTSVTYEEFDLVPPDIAVPVAVSVSAPAVDAKPASKPRPPRSKGPVTAKGRTIPKAAVKAAVKAAPQKRAARA
jgi:uncharacterized protein YegP (UPF0339 family)